MKCTPIAKCLESGDFPNVYYRTNTVALMANTKDSHEPEDELF